MEKYGRVISNIDRRDCWKGISNLHYNNKARREHKTLHHFQSFSLFAQQEEGRFIYDQISTYNSDIYI